MTIFLKCLKYFMHLLCLVLLPALFYIAYYTGNDFDNSSFVIKYPEEATLNRLGDIGSEVRAFCIYYFGKFSFYIPVVFFSFYLMAFIIKAKFIVKVGLVNLFFLLSFFYLSSLPLDQRHLYGSLYSVFTHKLINPYVFVFPGAVLFVLMMFRWITLWTIEKLGSKQEPTLTR